MRKAVLDLMYVYQHLLPESVKYPAITLYIIALCSTNHFDAEIVLNHGHIFIRNTKDSDSLVVQIKNLRVASIGISYLRKFHETSVAIKTIYIQLRSSPPCCLKGFKRK